MAADGMNSYAPMSHVPTRVKPRWSASVQVSGVTRADRRAAGEKRVREGRAAVVATGPIMGFGHQTLKSDATPDVARRVVGHAVASTRLVVLVVPPQFLVVFCTTRAFVAS